MSINSVTSYNNAVSRQLEIRQVEQRHNAEMIQDRRDKKVHDETEQKRIEMNRRMNRPGQNIDKIA